MLHHDSQKHGASLAQCGLTLIWDNLGFLSYGIKDLGLAIAAVVLSSSEHWSFKSGVEDSNILSRLSN